MKTIKVATQAEWDALPSYTQNATIEIRGAVEVRVQKADYIEAYGSSTVRACDSSTVTAYGSSTVTACDSSTVTAYGSSTVTACDSSTVRATGANAVHVHSQYSTIDFVGLAVVFLKVLSERIKGDKARIFDAIPRPGVEAWAEREGVEINDGAMVLYKRVSKDWKTQEDTRNETTWGIGSTLEIKNWKTPDEECGEGKFHACSLPVFCDEFRSTPGDRYIAISVAVTDAHAWPNGGYPHKIAFRKGNVLHEVDINGKEKK